MPIYSLDRGEEIGEVENLIFDPHQREVVGFVLEEGGLFRSPQIVPFESIESIGPDVLVLKRGASLELPSEQADPKQLKEGFNLTGRRVISERGHEIGAVYDLEIDERTGTVTGMEVRRGLFQDTAEGRKRIGFEYIQQIGKDAVIVSEGALEALAAQKGGLSATYQSMKVSGAATFQSVKDSSVESLERVRGRSGTFGATAREKREAWGRTAQERMERLRERSRAGFDRGKSEASRFWEDLRSGFGRFRTRVEGYFDWLGRRLQQRRIDQAAGRRVSRTILDPSDNVILHQGEMITYNAIRRAKEAGVLEILLDSVVKENIFALRRKETQSTAEEIFAKRPTPPS
jgi:uncharacterized protein YrrD